MSYQYVKDSRKRRKEDIVYVMGGCCQICGYNRAITALDLHHLNPADKEFGIGAILNKDWELMNSEIQKCILVCANCHREIHEGLITKDEALLKVDPSTLDQLLHDTFDEEDLNFRYTERLRIININVDYYKKLCYTKDENELSLFERVVGSLGVDNIDIFYYIYLL